MLEIVISFVSTNPSLVHNGLHGPGPVYEEHAYLPRTAESNLYPEN
jgi:hypothetical protein